MSKFNGLEIMKMISKGKIEEHKKFNFSNNNFDNELVEYENGTLYLLIYDDKGKLESRKNIFDIFTIQSIILADFNEG